ncbi:MAG: acetyl-CoA carboxylase biotin carboxylase subunit [Planctomycetes bacterium]|nr:acetyl-CoA carboxylase biotin carboxylase subunit [Planctomycetota bacterium]
MISRVLIANRGEIALRILRACQELDLDTVVVYSEADAGAIYRRFADASICIGPGPAASSYLDIPRIIAAAEVSDIDAIHPGYGFLAENPHFAEICENSKITFIGPPSKAIRAVGDKVNARALAREAGVPIVPGSDGLVEDENQAAEVAQALGYPVLLKAAAGGGGRGMRVAHNRPSLKTLFAQAREEARAAFKDGGLYVEKCLERPRHVEFQVLADTQGAMVHLFERDCSIQRRHQKLIEEAPSPALTPALRQRMGEAALRIARRAGYVNAGTVEFLLDRAGEFYFIEMNARLQVEHPVTEMATGVDIVQQQLRIAMGKPLGFTQEEVALRGWTMECRITAEDPAQNFRPAPGRIATFFAPGGPGVRFDSHVHAGYVIPPFYDSMIGKLIVHRDTREAAIQCMGKALRELVIEGENLRTTIPLYRDIFAHSKFVGGEVDTHFIDDYFLRAG